MELTPTQLPRAREENLVAEEMPDGLLIYDLIRLRCHRLNNTAALIWRH
jgi:hypothetical protein